MSHDTDRNKETVRRIYEDAINDGDLAYLDRVIRPEFEGAQGGRGPAAFRATVEALRRGVPDLRFTIVELVAERDRVVVQWRWTGTHEGVLFGIPPSRRRIENDGVAIYELRDGGVSSGWVLTDRLGVLQQIGVVPDNPGVAAAP